MSEEDAGSLLDVGGDGAVSEPSDSPNFYWAENVAGEGDKPEFLLDKYGSVADQAKAYPELQKKLGGFTGAPESYALPDDVSDDDAEYVKALVEAAADSNMNQETFDRIMEIGEGILSAKEEMDRDVEIEKLGENAEGRLQAVAQFLQNNLGDKYDELQFAVNNADVVMLLEEVIKATAPAKLPTAATESAGKVTQADIDSAVAKKDAEGNVRYYTDEAYRNQVQDMMKRVSA